MKSVRWISPAALLLAAGCHDGILLGNEPGASDAGGYFDSAMDVVTPPPDVPTDAAPSNIAVDGAGSVLSSPTYATDEVIETLAAGQTQVHCIAIDATSVYWADYGAGTVMKVSVGGGAPTTLASGQGYAGGIAVDSTSVYWSGYQSGGGAAKVALDGGTPVFLGLGILDDNIAVNSSSVFGTTNGGSTLSLVAIPITGGPARTLDVQPNDNQTYGLAVDSTSIYWSNFGSGSAIVKTPLDGSASTTLASAQTVFGVAVDATSVYWANSGDGTVKKVPINGGAVTTLADLYGANQIAIDDSSVYLSASANGGSIVRVAKDGSAVTFLATNQGGAGGIAVDATSIYWTTGSAIMKATPK